MPYTKSISRNEFDLSIDSRLKQSKCISKEGISVDIRQAVYHAAIFHGCAALEEYLKNIFENWVYQLKHNNKTLKEVPTQLRSMLLVRKQHNAFSSYLFNSDESKIIGFISEDKTLLDGYSENTSASSFLNNANLIADRKYPSHKNLKSLFNRFGMPSIFHRIEIKGRKDYKLLLQSFLDVRTEIAHNHPPTALTNCDIKKHLTNLKDLVNQLDRIAYSQTLRISGSDCWSTPSS